MSKLNNLNNLLKSNVTNNVISNVISNEEQTIIDECKKDLDELVRETKELITKLNKPSKEIEKFINDYNNLSTKFNSIKNTNQINTNQINTHLKNIYPKIITLTKLLEEKQYSFLKNKTQLELEFKSLINKSRQNLTKISEILKDNTLKFGKTPKLGQNKENKEKNVFVRNFKGRNTILKKFSNPFLIELNSILNQNKNLYNNINKKFKNFLETESESYKVIKLKKDFQIFIIKYYINKYKQLFSKNSHINFEQSDKNILESLLKIKQTITKLDTDLSYLNTEIIINKNNININDLYKDFIIVINRFKNYLNYSIKELQERLTTDISKIDIEIEQYIDAIIKLIEEFNTRHNNNKIYGTNGLEKYKNVLQKYRDNLGSKIKENYFNALLQKMEQGLTTISSKSNLTLLEPINNSINIETYSLNNKFQMNDIISWTDEKHVEKYGRIIGEYNEKPNYRKVQLITINNNNNIQNNLNNRNNGGIRDIQIIKDNNLIVEKIGTYNPESRKITKKITK